jgi:DNA methyltransferase 1-associated protein 1
MKRKEVGDVYAFARFNRKAAVVTYTDDQYDKVVAPLKSDWTKLETDVLFDLCQRFNLRFIVIADRFAYELQERVEA